MTDISRATPGTGLPSGLGADTANRIAEACAAIAPFSTLVPAAERVLSLLAEATGAFRVSLMALNPATGRLAVIAAIGLSHDYVGRAAAPRRRSIAEWVFRHRCGIILNGEVRDHRFEGTQSGGSISSAMSVPLESTAGPVCVVNLSRRSESVFEEPEIAVIAAMLAPLAEAVERATSSQLAARARRQLLRMEANSSKSLMAAGEIEVRHYEMATYRCPSLRLSGDLFDRVPHAEGAHSLLALDVSGDGAEAARSAAFVQGLFVALAAPQRSAAGMVARLNTELRTRLGEARLTAMWVAQLSSGGELAYCNAGYPAPLWVPGDGSPVVRLDRGGPMAGAVAHSAFDEERLQLFPGDLVVAVSDGVLESRDERDEPFGVERVSELIIPLRYHPLDHVARTICDAALEFSGCSILTDDFAVFALRYRPGN